MRWYWDDGRHSAVVHATSRPIFDRTLRKCSIRSRGCITVDDKRDSCFLYLLLSVEDSITQRYDCRADDGFVAGESFSCRNGNVSRTESASWSDMVKSRHSGPF
jgi:hypothetical protein